MIEALFRKRANRLQAKCVALCREAHGAIGETTFVRCLSCHHIVTANKIELNGQCWCGNKTYKETNLTIAEEIKWIGRAIIWKLKQR